MSELFITVLNMSISASYVILAVMLVRLLLKRAPKAISCALWTVVLFRLLCPFSRNSVLSLLQVKPQAIPHDIGNMAVPRVNSGITAFDRVVNDLLPEADPYMSINPMQTVLAVASIVWLLGTAGLLVYAIVSAVRLHIRLSGAQQLEGNVYVAGNLGTPFVLGIIRPRIYLPEALSEHENVHERMHIRRRDPFMKAIAFLALSLHWFNPFVWISFILLAKDMEMACDEAVLREMGPGIKKEYSTSLLSLATKHLIFNGTPMAFGEGEVQERVKNILKFKNPEFWVIVVAVVIVVIAGVGLALNPSEENSPQSPGSGMEPEWLASAWKERTPYAGKASSIGNVIASWYTIFDASGTGFELYTDEAPNGVKIFYDVNSTSILTPDEVFQHYLSYFEQNSIILFALVENLDYIQIDLGEASVHTFLRETYEEQYGELWPQSETPEALEKLYENITARQAETIAQPQDDQFSEQPHNGQSAGQPQDGQSPADPQEAGWTVQPLEENPDYQYLLKLFPDFAEPQYSDTPVEADLDGDGVMEQISAKNLGGNGGDGACLITVSRLVNGKYTEIPLPGNYAVEQKFPVQMQWDGQELRIVFTDSTYQIVPVEVLASIYEAGLGIDAMDKIKGNPIVMDADAVSDFTIVEEDANHSTLILKQYITGPLGSHVDRIGYAITELKLKEDNTWDMIQYFLPAF